MTTVLQQFISMGRDELAGRGLYRQHRAKGDRRQQLEQQIERWEALLEKLGGSNSE